MITDDIEQYERYSPFMAALAGRDEAAQEDLYLRFSKLPDEIADVLTSTDTAEKIALWEQQGIFPATHASAIAKLIALSILEIIQPDQILSLLQKLNMDPATAQRTSDAIITIVGPALSFLQGYRRPVTAFVQPNMQELPPLTTKIPSLPEQSASTLGAGQHIIDLRRQNPPDA